MTDAPAIPGEKQEIPRNPDGTFPPGVSGNPAGKPKGARHFNTLLDQAIKQIAEANDLDGLQIEIDLLKMAIKKAREGDYQYYKDLMDRRHGQARAKIDVGLDEELTEIQVNIIRNNEDKPPQQTA